MARLSPHAVGLVSVLAAARTSALLLAERRGPRTVEAGFWFEPVSHASTRIGGALTPAAIHPSRDPASYQYRSAARPEQFFGDMRWDLAKPLLQARWGW